jgi:DNA-binding CsgD family transcriptional regulator/nucleoside-triphosphatase THEP1
VATRVTSTRFVGRLDELTELEDLLERVGDGHAWMAFVTGESGMGKTRLMDEFARRAREAGARILSGDCVELGDSELPYAPIVSALRPLVRSGDQVLADLGSSGDGLTQLFRGATTQSELFETLLALLDRLGEIQPVVLIIDDIHWADRSTRDFLVFLSRTLCRERVLVLATYRSDELHRRHPLLPVVSELQRGEGCVTIPLRPFTRDELAAQLGDILGGAPDADLLNRLETRSEGNPLFAEELLAAGRDGRGEVPPTLRDALMLRVEALPDDAQDVLRVVAAAQRIAHDVLEQVSGIEPRALRAALREAVGQRLLVVGDDGQYAFRHALLREAVHDDLLPGEHAELHTALAEVLEHSDGAATLEVQTEVAHHWSAAGDRERGLAAAVRAATAAEAVHAHGEAAALLERALELWPKVPSPETLTACDHVDLLRRAAIDHGASQNSPRMRTLLRKALEEIDSDAEPARAALLLERLGKALWDLGESEMALARWDEALALLPTDPPTTERAMVLAGKAMGLMLGGRYPAAADVCREAIAIARQVGAPAAEDSALNTLGVCLGAMGDVEGGEEALLESMRLAREGGRMVAVSRGYVNLTDVLFLGGRLSQARDLALAGIRELEGIRSNNWLRISLSEIEFQLGNWDAADAVLARDGGTFRFGTGRVMVLIRLGEQALARGDVETAVGHLEDARTRAQTSIEPQWHGPIAALLAQSYRYQRRWDDARAAVDEGMKRVAGHTQDIGRITRVAAAGIAAEADRAQWARDVGRTDEERDAIERARRLLVIAREIVSGQIRGLPLARAHVADAEADTARAEGHADPDLYAAAASQWDALGRIYDGARARRRQAEALAARGDRDGAAAAAVAAREVAEQVGAQWLVDELDTLARRARLRLVGPADAPAPASDDVDLGLTPRELEVLVLLAEGRTNREIGEALYMAEKTASVHVSRILAKLDVRTRTEAAAVAHRLGLAA